MRKIFLISVIFSIAFSQEPSAFGSGASADIKNETKIINEKLFNLSKKIDFLDESQEGLKSVFDGQMQRIQEVTNKIHAMQSENNVAMADVRNHVDSNFTLQNENIENLKKSITALSEVLVKNNAQLKEEIQSLKNEMYDIISKESPIKEVLVASKNIQQEPEKKVEKEAEEELPKEALQENKPNEKQNENIANADFKNDKDIQKEALVEENQVKDSKNDNPQKQDDSKIALKNEKEAPKEEKQEAKDSQRQDVQKTKALESLKNKELALVFKEGEEYLKAKNYELASEYLQFAVKGHYKPARGNYLLGEIAFMQKRYQDAIYYYKVSATRYDKADYMPNLMLNSAKSFIETKQKDNAKRFLETLLQLYPETKEAEESKKILSNL